MTITNTNPQINVDKPNAFHRNLTGYVHEYCVDAIHVNYCDDFSIISNIVMIIDFSKFAPEDTKPNFMLTRDSKAQIVKEKVHLIMLLYNPHNAHVLPFIEKYNKMYAEYCEANRIPKEF